LIKTNILNKKNSQFILLGLGSVGKRHADFLSSFSNNLICVDPKNEARKWAGQNLKGNFEVFDSLKNVSKSILVKTPKIGVVANLGPTHFESICDLIKIGVKALYIEKPISNSLKSLDEILKLCKKNSIKLLGGFQHRYAGIFEKVLEISKKKLGGLPTLMCVNGGAMGIVTNGIHYLDLAVSIFQSHPTYVISDLRNMKINPRSKALDFWEGSATWGFKNNKQLSINTSNFSSVRQRAEIFCPYGKISINEDLSLSVFIRDKNEILSDSRMVRLGTAKKKDKPAIKPKLENLYKKIFSFLIEGNYSMRSLERELIATRAMIFALIANKESKKIFLSKVINKKWYGHQWPIS